MEKRKSLRLVLITLIVILIPLSFFIALLPRLLYPNPFQGERLHVRVGVYENAPKVFRDENGKWTGFWPDIIEEIAVKEGWIIDYVGFFNESYPDGPFNESLVEGLGKGKIDIMVDVAFSKDRMQKYNLI
nr:transporter substrate-binding domain-containing protein [Candidatus Sigynarchaeota archaeon]